MLRLVVIGCIISGTRFGFLLNGGSIFLCRDISCGLALVIICSYYTVKCASIVYPLRTHKGSRFGQRHGLQNTTLTSCFYKNIY